MGSDLTRALLISNLQTGMKNHKAGFTKDALCSWRVRPSDSVACANVLHLRWTWKYQVPVVQAIGAEKVRI